MKKVKILISLILVPQIMMSWTYAYSATPAIFAVIGTVATGKMISVSGVNLMHLNTMNWVKTIS